MSLSKTNLINIFKRKFVRNEDLSEVAISRTDLNFLLAILDEYDSFYNFEKEIGYLGRHSREREKYKLFQTMFNRYKREGSEALRPKNIDEKLTLNIIKSFGSISNLTKKSIIDTSEDTVLFTAHTYFISGGSIDNIKIYNPDLYSRIIEKFGSIFTFAHFYQKKLFLNPLEDFKDSKDKTIDLNAGLSEDNKNNIEIASCISVEEIIDFLYLNGLEDKTVLFIKKNYPVYYIAIEINGGIDAIHQHPLFTSINFSRVV